MSLTSGYYGYDGYDANGDRVYKLTGESNIRHPNNELSDADIKINDIVLYPNPYVTITPKSYTKHYYAGSERLASSIGQGGWCSMSPDVISETQTEHEYRVQKHWNDMYINEFPFEYYHENPPVLTQNVDIYDGVLSELQYRCPVRHLRQLNISLGNINLLAVMQGLCGPQAQEDVIYYTHGDHLGSANWITDFHGVPVQYIHYLPYGQLLANQASYGYDERYKFTGKERDAESGYDYFGARFYWSLFKHWTSVDPLVDNYLHISPYAYCNWNPVKFVDPDGYFPWWSIAGAAIDYGFQVHDNYKIGKSGFDAWIGDVNFIQVGLSAVNPTGKFAIAKTLLVEGAKALTKGSSLNSGININENLQEVAQEAITNTVISSTTGKIVDAGSDKAVNAVNTEMKTASKQLKTAERQAQRNPNSINKVTQVDNAKGNVQNARAKQVRTKMLHSTVGQNPEASQIILNKSADRVRKSQDND